MSQNYSDSNINNYPNSLQHVSSTCNYTDSFYEDDTVVPNNEQSTSYAAQYVDDSEDISRFNDYTDSTVSSSSSTTQYIEDNANFNGFNNTNGFNNNINVTSTPYNCINTTISDKNKSPVFSNFDDTQYIDNNDNFNDNDHSNDLRVPTSYKSDSTIPRYGMQHIDDNIGFIDNAGFNDNGFNNDTSNGLQQTDVTSIAPYIEQPFMSSNTYYCAQCSDRAQTFKFEIPGFEIIVRPKSY